MPDVSGKPSPLLLSDDEQRVLELYDRLQQLQLEIALITAQKEYEPSEPTPAKSLFLMCPADVRRRPAAIGRCRICTE